MDKQNSKERKTRTIRAESELWERGKFHCLKNHTNMSEYIEKLMRKDLEKEK